MNKFLKHSVIYSISTFLTRGMAFILLPILTKSLNPHEYGTIDMINITGMFVLIVFGLESYQGIARHIAEYDSPLGNQKLFSSAIYFLCASYLVFFILSNILAPLLFSFAIPVKSRELLNIVVLTYFAQAIIVNCQAALRYDIQVKESVITSVITALCILISNLIFVVWLKFGLIGAIYALLLGNICGAISALFYTRNYLGKLWELRIIKQIISFTFPLAISAIFTVIMLYIDRIALSKLMSLNEVGLFGVGFRIASIVTLIMAGVQGALGPLIYNNLKDPATPSNLARLFEKFIVIACLFILGINFFASELLYIFADKAYFVAHNLIKILVVAIILSQMYMFFPGMNIKKETKIILYLNIMGALINIILNYILIKAIGLNGAALATLFSYTIFILIFAYSSQKRYYLQLNYKIIGKNLAFLVCGILINQLSFNIINSQQFIIKSVIYIIFILVFMRVNNIKLNLRPRFY